MKDYRVLTHKILDYAKQSILQKEFLHEVLKMIIEFSNSDAIDLWIKVEGYFSCLSVKTSSDGALLFDMVRYDLNTKTMENFDFEAHNGMDKLLKKIILNFKKVFLPFFTTGRSYWIDDLNNFKKVENLKNPLIEILGLDDYKSFAVIPIFISDEKIGLLQLKSKQPSFFTQEEIINYEDIVFILGIILVSKDMEAALRERIKELTCLYGIAKIAERANSSIHNILSGIVELIPSAWKYPNIAQSKIILDDHSYPTTTDFSENWQKQTADIVVKGKCRGSLIIAYSEKKEDIDEGPFLKEERSLIDEIARQVALIIERRETNEDKMKLNEQLRHADRLATIGQLAAGIAHELNEPIGNILGFAQLIKKESNLSEQTTRDIDKIINATLHAREVIRKLMTFARQTPPKIKKVDLNHIIEESLYVINSRCLKQDIKLNLTLAPNLPKITADPTQLNQLLINLVVNSIQAMPDGGTLKVCTNSTDSFICLTIEDTGVGMDGEVLNKLFIPFFTTKDKHHGTGLGLSVVHGIVTSHGGSIEVHSKINQGTKFEIHLPLKGPYDLKDEKS
ncbi:hypothetical protein KKB18_03645 [bacterium]|nr:hypothetical protein [bacterium]